MLSFNPHTHTQTKLFPQKKLFCLETLFHLSCWVIIFSFFFSVAEAADASKNSTKKVTVITYRSPASESDTRELYYEAVLKLALEKTRKTYGDYEMQYAPVMTEPREFNAISNEQFPNYIIDDNYEDKFANSNIDYVPFPVELGVLGVRICFISPEAKKRINQTSSLDDIKKLTIGQGIGWADSQILRYNGFKVFDIEHYDSAFKMVASNRIDLFCRGMNELPLEIKSHQKISGLTFDTSFALSYPLPRFFIHNKKNTELHKRVEEGLKIAYADGSLIKLWNEHYQANIEFVHLEKRNIYILENPLIKNLNKDYEIYLFNSIKNK